MTAVKIALASSDGKFIDLHFGKCARFRIIEFNLLTKDYKEIQIRNAERLCAQGGHTHENLRNTTALLSDCKYIITARIGIWIVSELKQNGIEPVEFFGPVEEALKRININ
jgi:predicted Fe-Mo cluster-binding NifX family protein